MVAFADSVEYARRLLPLAEWRACSRDELEPEVQVVLERLQPGGHWLCSEWQPAGFARIVLVESAPSSQFDVLRELSGRDQLPAGGTLCVAGSGAAFHGHRQRAWVALPGNLHVSVVFTPECVVPHHGASFMALPAVAAASAIESALRVTKAVGIKWVNDVLIEGAKVAGVIAHTSAVGDRVARVVLGIGLNVEATPQIDRCPFVPRAGSLRQYDREVTQAEVFSCLLEHLAGEYQALLRRGPSPLLAAYRRRSVVIGRHVEVDSEGTAATAVVAGRVQSIGDDLELILEERSAPVVRGRLRFRAPGA